MKGKKAILFRESHLLGKGVAEEAYGYILRRGEIGDALTGGKQPKAYFIFCDKQIDKKVNRNNDSSEFKSSL